jgi:putative oxidoreductase
MLVQEVTAMTGTLWQLRDRLLAMVSKVAWLGPLLGRLTIGLMFLGTGWGKLHGLDKVTDYFTQLHIPAPHAQAIVVACTEFFGGLALVLGVLTRLAALPLAVTMVVAILTAKRDDIQGLISFASLEEFTYLCVLLWLAIAGPGAASVDGLIARSAKKS